MGGVKRRSITSMEKAQKLREEKEKMEARKKKTAIPEKKAQNVTLPRIDEKTLINEIKKMKIVTPSTIASTFSLRVSIAKDFLEELRKKGIIELVSGCRRLKIYKPTVSAA
ncbi:MAG: hypothetical protein N3E48_00655 [Candidatus Bathyarchaeota archaeon]|nr:hypothetical protein [Candidatus Bathyarchaeota archaeon]